MTVAPENAASPTIQPQRRKTEMTHIPGTASAEEMVHLQALAAIRKAAGADNDDPKIAAEHALDRLARKRAASANISVAAAYDLVTREPEGSNLYSVSKGAIAVTDAAAALAHIRKVAT
jgi:hypothetical protein